MILPRPRIALRCLLLLACSASSVVSSQIQSWPRQPVKIIVPFVTGGASDTVARLLAPELSATIGQPVLVENLVGAGGAIAAKKLTRSAPDGYTLMYGGISETVLIPSSQVSAGYAPQDLQAVSILGSTPLALAVRANFPASNIDSLVQFSRSNPLKLSYGSSGVGSYGHLLVEGLEHQLGLEMLHIPYKGSGQMLNDLAGGQIDMALTSLASAMPYFRAGKIRLLGVSSSARLVESGETPTFHESSALANSQISIWAGIFSPQGLPSDIGLRINDAFAKVLQNRKVRDRLINLGTQPDRSRSPSESQAFFEQQIQQYRSLATTMK